MIQKIYICWSALPCTETHHPLLFIIQQYFTVYMREKKDTGFLSLNDTKHIQFFFHMVNINIRVNLCVSMCSEVLGTIRFLKLICTGGQLRRGTTNYLVTCIKPFFFGGVQRRFLSSISLQHISQSTKNLISQTFLR